MSKPKKRRHTHTNRLRRALNTRSVSTASPTLGRLSLCAGALIGSFATSAPAGAGILITPRNFPAAWPSSTVGRLDDAPGQEERDFQIPAGALGDVVAAIGRIGGITITMPTEDIASLSSPGVSGTMSIEQALAKALAGTGVSARFVSAGRVLLELRLNAESVNVTAPAAVLPSPKYTSAIRDLPRTITVIPESVIQSTGSATLVEALRTVPGITLGAGEGGNPVGDRPFIRGSDAQSSTFVDGVRDIGSQSREVFNLESVEVSKGPSGAYGGRGTAGGSLNLNSKTAKAANSMVASFTPGSANYYRGTFDGNVRLSDSAAVRLNLLEHDSDVPGRDAVHNNRWGIAPTLSLGIGKGTRANVSFYKLKSDDVPDTGIPYNNPNFNARTDGLARELTAGDGSPVDVDRHVFYGLLDRDFRHENVETTTAHIEHDLARRLTLRNVTRYTKSSQDYIWTQPDDSQGNLYYGMVWRRNNNRISDVRSTINQTDLYGGFSTKHIAHNFAIGAEFSREKGENDAYTVATGNNRCLTGTGSASEYNCTSLTDPDPSEPWAGTITRNNNPTNSSTITKSVYAFDTIELSRRWQSNLGLRIDDYSAEFTSAVAAATGLRTSYERRDTLVNYQAGLVFKPTAPGTIYGSYSTSSVPTGNALAQGSDSSALSSTVNAGLTPEVSRSVEGGVKWEAFGSRALLTAAVFHISTSNARITLQDGTVAMAGERRVNGTELGLAGRVTPAWQIFGGYTLLDAILVSNGGSGAAFGLQDGSAYPNTPKHSMSVSSTYTIRDGLSAGGGVYYVSKVWGSEPNNKWIPSYWRLDATMTYRIHEHLSLQGNIQNLTDAVYFDKAYPTHYASIAPGRAARLTFNVPF